MIFVFTLFFFFSGENYNKVSKQSQMKAQTKEVAWRQSR